MSVIRAAGLAISLMVSATHVVQGQTHLMSISGSPPPAKLQPIVGNGWFVYLDGEIDADAGKRLDAFIEVNRIPRTSIVILNSIGGSALGGMELGRVIRKHGLSVDVGVKKINASGARSYGPGVCLSACATAYLGGRYRFLNRDSRYGMHRFYFSTKTEFDADRAQMLSALMIGYIREMGIDTDFFSLSTAAGSDAIFEPPREKLTSLHVVNDGFTEPRWNIESYSGMLYLQGSRDTFYGANKVVLFCQRGKGITLYVFFDPQGRGQELMVFGAHSIVIDGKDEPISPTYKGMQEGWFNIDYKLSPGLVRRVLSATTIGFIVRASYEAPIFFGFNSMPFQEARPKLQGLLNGCGYAS